ncbi:translation initiation factor sui1 protein [Cyclospora cayetanensis]|uniref:Translation initiation factor sui1 protein n=1 Tax=Cyclospora cayetanensis TaxID=88456 RepID=A0A1D3CZ06_9EIME|nr:translation initiation factor sui1 protein [Cyclospora cayetanensis]
MSVWRSCCGSFWGSSSSSDVGSQSTVGSKSSTSSESWKEEAIDGVDSPDQDFQPHSEASADLLAKKWITHVQKRAAKVWERDQVLDMLRTIAQSVSYSDDPILGDPSPGAPCVQWHGDLSMEQGLPVIHVRKTGQENVVPSYVCKLFTFLFADDESLKLLKETAAGTVSMNCGNSKCVRLSHFVGYTSQWALKYQPKAKAPAKASAKARGAAAKGNPRPKVRFLCGPCGAAGRPPRFCPFFVPPPIKDTSTPSPCLRKGATDAAVLPSEPRCLSLPSKAASLETSSSIRPHSVLDSPLLLLSSLRAAALHRLQRQTKGALLTTLSAASRLREALLRSFPLLTDDGVDTLLPSKETVVLARMNLPQASQAGGSPQQLPGSLAPLMSASSANKCALYFIGDLPVVSEVNGLLFPTIHGLWRVPHMLPCMLVFSPVSHFVLKGADLMLPGLCRPLTIAASRAVGIEEVALGSLWAVRVVGNALPFAIGRAVTRAPSLELLGDKGRALELIHHLGDALWKSGKHVPLPPLFTAHQVFSGSDDAELLASCGMGPPEALPGALHQGEQSEAFQEGRATAEDADSNEAVAPDAGACSAADDADDGGQSPSASPEAEASSKAASAAELPMKPERRLCGDVRRVMAALLLYCRVAMNGRRYYIAIFHQHLAVSYEMDAYLNLCLLETLHSLSDEQLPLDISALYSKLTSEAPAVFYTQVAKGDAPFVVPDIRRSSAKKLAKFIQGASKKKLLQTKEQRGVVSVVKVNRSHPEFIKHTPVPETQKRKLIERVAAASSASSPAAAGAAGEEGLSKETLSQPSTVRSGDGPLVFEFCVPPAKCCKVFAAAGVQTGKSTFFTGQEYREVLTKYLEVRNTKREHEPLQSLPEASEALQGSRGCSTVALDPLLAEAVLSKEERIDAKAAGGEIQMMEKAELYKRWNETQQPCHAVIRNEAELPLLQERIIKGPCCPVRISVEDKQGGRKHATHILNVVNFLLDPKAIAEFLQKKLAASASVYAPPGSKTTSAVCVQGNVAGPVADLLISHFGVPKKYVEVATKKPKFVPELPSVLDMKIKASSLRAFAPLPSAEISVPLCFLVSLLFYATLTVPRRLSRLPPLARDPMGNLVERSGEGTVDQRSRRQGYERTSLV